jgi:hypothetical protein
MTARSIKGAVAIALLSMIASQASAYEPIMLEKLGAVRMASPEAGLAVRESPTTSPASGPAKPAAAEIAPAADPAPYMIMLERLGAVRMARPQEAPVVADRADVIEVADMD